MGNSFAIPMSRRSFMKLMGLAAAGTVLGVKGDAAKAEAASPTISTMDFDNAELPVLFDADVCVVGGGVAGTAAAVTAARKGAKGCSCGARHFPGGTGHLGLCFPMYGYLLL